ncbi:hypothetical protein BLS_002470 [Venturia inaequalis]|uniref:RDRP core domain-containing protein n=1 Tax=Venturia inaequalis TaxID=5025 RepID=A0A8H3UUV4_VENIN|nr:hypothetical protein BLS_002470 [Venturia inaequalis]
MASKVPSHPTSQPRTPSGRAHEAINKRVQDLNARWDLGLKPRDGIWTPRHGQGTIAEQCVERIKYLHYSATAQLDSLLSQEFPRLARQTPLNGRLPLLFGLLNQLFPSTSPKVSSQGSRVKNRIFREGDPEVERPSGTTELDVSPGLVERTNNVSHRGARTFSEDPEVEDLHAQILAEYEAEDRRLGLSDRAFGVRLKKPDFHQPSTPPSSDTEEDGSDVFFSPPGSPTEEAAERKQAQISPSMSSSINYQARDRRKRRSDVENISPPKRRISETNATNSAYYFANPVLKPPALIETFRSSGTPIESAMTSFAASTPGLLQDNGRQIESANTSFGSDMVGPADEAMSSPWEGSSMPSLPPDLDNVITNQGLDGTVPFIRPASKSNSVPSEGRLSTNTRDSLSTETRIEMIEVAARSELRAARGPRQPAAASSNAYHEPIAGSSATTETMSTAERDAIYDFTDMVVEQSFRQTAAETQPRRGLKEHSDGATSHKGRTIRPASPSIRQQQKQLHPTSRASTATNEIQNRDIDSPLQRHDSEDFRLSSLPKQHMFIDEGKEVAVLSVMPFKTRFECSRVALASGLPIHTFATQDVLRITTYDELWSHFKKIAQEEGVVLPKKSSASAWDDTSARCEYVNLKARLSFNDEANSRQSLFKLHIDPIGYERPCRFQYKYGGDRFLYLFLPNLELKEDPSYLTQAHKPDLIRRLQQWLRNEKNFFGRRWRVMHVEPVKEKSQAKRRERMLSYRIILFATHGYDILPKLVERPYKTSSPETTIEEIVNWFMPLQKTAHQPYCKAFARLDLGFSKTWRTIVFKPSQVIRVPDIMSDGTPEATEFDDQGSSCDWSGYQRPVKPTAMNDGCSRISVGACREIWKKLRLTGPIPSAFQARINGAKGVWIRSAPTDTKSSHHLDVWIEISASQEKFKAHDLDTDENFDPIRWTFEVVSTTHSLKSNTLNVAFIPILEDRNVRHADLQGLIKGIMDAERHDIVSSFRDPVSLRAWVHKHMVSDENRNKNEVVDDKRKGALPFALVDRVIHLLEAGFAPNDLPILGDFVEKVARKHFSLAVASFKIQLPRSTMVIGVADPTGTLQPGEISMIFSKPIIDEISGEVFPFLDNKEVLVARHPSLRSSDIQKVRAVYRPELAYLTDVVVFPSKGRVPLAGKLQGGDYDGDTFWVCWEPALTKDFENAPAPLPDQLAEPEALGIKVDRRKLGEFLSETEPVDRFLSESFKFRFQPDLLGRCTNLHKRLAYRENSLNSGGVSALANLHDYLIDSSKNGYIFTDKNFEQYVREYTTLDRASLKEKGYEEAMMVGFEDDQLLKSIQAPPNLDRILDMLYFSLMEPEIRAAINDVKNLCELKNDELDDALAEPLQFEIREGDAVIRQEIHALMNAFPHISDTWNRTMFPNAKGLVDEGRSQGGRERWSAAIDKCHPMYEALMPQNIKHPIIKRWIKRRHQGPTEWDLIKASALYRKYPHKTFKGKALFIWNMAGNHLMYIKGIDDPNTRPIRPNMLDAMKPTKLKLAAREYNGPVMGSPPVSPGLGEKILKDFTQHQDDDYPSDGDGYSSAADFLDRG